MFDSSSFCVCLFCRHTASALCTSGTHTGGVHPGSAWLEWTSSQRFFCSLFCFGHLRVTVNLWRANYIRNTQAGMCNKVALSCLSVNRLSLLRRCLKRDPLAQFACQNWNKLQVRMFGGVEKLFENFFSSLVSFAGLLIVYFFPRWCLVRVRVCFVLVTSQLARQFHQEHTGRAA